MLINKSNKNEKILGNTDKRLKDKLEEAKQYVKDAPYAPISWTQ